jgi:hypothetical protein
MCRRMVEFACKEELVEMSLVRGAAKQDQTVSFLICF